MLFTILFHCYYCISLFRRQWICINITTYQFIWVLALRFFYRIYLIISVVVLTETSSLSDLTSYEISSFSDNLNY